MLDEVPTTESLSAAEAEYVAAARSANTLRGYTSDWCEFSTWCTANNHPAFPASPQAISTYLTVLAGHGAKVGTMSRRLSAIRFAHQLRNLPDPCEHARVVSVWEDIRRVHGPPVTLFVGLDARLLVARPGMTYFPCRTHDPGGVVTGFWWRGLIADRDTAVRTALGRVPTATSAMSTHAGMAGSCTSDCLRG